MPKWIKMIIAILLLPVCGGAAWAVWLEIKGCSDADTMWVPFLAGAGCWVVIYVLLPSPMWVYVFGHELTHALWTWLLGGRVNKFRATANGGHVVVSKSNFLIALAPYFFPLYAVMVVAFFAVGHRVWQWKNYLVWFHLLVGAAYAFHVTLTARILRTRQSDITQEGYLFSAVVIFLGNASVLLLGIPLLTPKVSILAAVDWWWEGTAGILQQLAKWL